MPKNVTVYVQDEIAAEMEKLNEVNWSEVCRDAILVYIAKRAQKFNSSAIRVSLGGLGANTAYFEQSYFLVTINIENPTEFKINFDRAKLYINPSVGKWNDCLFPMDHLDPVEIQKNSGTSITLYYPVSYRLAKKFEAAIGEDEDVIMSFNFIAYYTWKEGNFFTNHTLQTIIAHSNWKKHFVPNLKTPKVE